MLTKTLLSLPVMALAIAAAQTAEAPKGPEPLQFYKLEFTIREVEGAKVLNTRSYSMTVANDKNSSTLRTNRQMPVAMEPGGKYQFFGVGVNIDCRVLAEVQGSLAIYLSADISGVPTETASAAATAGVSLPPTVRQNKWSSNVIVPLKKPTVVYSSDDPVSKRQFQVEVTATPLR